MANVQASCRRFAAFPLMALTIVFLASVVPGGAQTAPTPPAQQSVEFQNPISSAQLAFLTGYAGHTTKELRKDKQFRALLKLTIPRTEYHYGRDMSLSDAVDEVLDGSPLPVNVRDGRFVTVTGLQGPYLRGRGFLWFDLQQGTALGGFYFTPTNGEPTPTLTIFSRQLKQTSLAIGQLPPAFVDDLSQWSAVSRVPAFSPRYFIPENGRKPRAECTTWIIAGTRREPPRLRRNQCDAGQPRRGRRRYGRCLLHATDCAQRGKCDRVDA